MTGIELTPEIPVSEVRELGVRAEGAGFETIYSSCHYNNRDPFAALALLADATEDVRLGPGVANPYEVHPVRLASQVATLDEHSGGRAVCGLGAGDRSTLRNLGVERERPLRRVLETMQVARELWAGERVSHDGTFAATDAGLNYAEEVSEVPVHVGAQGPHMLRMAAKHADGVLFNASHPRDVAWANERVAEGLAERPESRGDFEFAVFASVSVAEEREAAREAARPPVAFIAGGAADPVLERHGIDVEAASEVGAAVERGDFREAFAGVTDAMIDAFSVAGTPADVTERAAALREHADTVVCGSPLGPDRATAIELLGETLC
ncbi:5,10-methylenetetrahydromethanopterin reductase [Halarchaeum sp. P4]|uniref:5,10-methylenetetrahydromethanopterin reductase n=1 Tax=Halarchaeum sp. P4 TaxID=3421639 RepID=UPI003EB69D30